MNELVSVIILCRNNKETIAACIDAALRQTYPRIEINVIDNDSRDGSPGLIRGFEPRISFVSLERNLGFCRAMNLGIAAAKGIYILLLNADVVLENSFAAEAINAFRYGMRIGSVSGKLLRLGCAPGRLVKTKIIDSTGHYLSRSLCPFNRGSGEDDRGQYDKPGYVFGACGAAVMYRKEMLEAVRLDNEYFDENFFAYYEDADLDWRAQWQGWKCVYQPAAVAYHVRGGSSIKSAKRFIHGHYFKNRYLMMLKNVPLGLLPKCLPQLICFEAASVLELFLAPYLMRSVLKMIRLLPQTVRKRRAIQLRKNVSAAYIAQFMVSLEMKKRFLNHLRFYRKLIFSDGRNL